jgi:hypothetical protein
MPVIYDVANAFAIGEGLVGGLKSLWPRLGIVHLSDSPKGPGGTIRSAPARSTRGHCCAAEEAGLRGQDRSGDPVGPSA